MAAGRFPPRGYGRQPNSEGPELGDLPQPLQKLLELLPWVRNGRLDGAALARLASLPSPECDTLIDHLEEGRIRAVENVADYLVGKNWRLAARRSDFPTPLPPATDTSRRRVLPREQERGGWTQPRVWDENSGRWYYPGKGETADGLEAAGPKAIGRPGSRREEGAVWNVYKSFVGFEELGATVKEKLLDMASQDGIYIDQKAVKVLRRKDSRVALDTVIELQESMQNGGVRNPSSYLLGVLNRLEGNDPQANLRKFEHSVF